MEKKKKTYAQRLLALCHEQEVAGKMPRCAATQGRCPSSLGAHSEDHQPAVYQVLDLGDYHQLQMRTQRPRDRSLSEALDVQGRPGASHSNHAAHVQGWQQALT